MPDGESGVHEFLCLNPGQHATIFFFTSHLYESWSGSSGPKFNDLFLKIYRK